MRPQEQWMCLTSSRGKEVVAGEMGPHCDCCKRKCSQVFNEEERKDIFSSYWSYGEVNVQRVYCWLCKKVNIGAYVSNKVRVEKKIHIDVQPFQEKRSESSL